MLDPTPAQFSIELCWKALVCVCSVHNQNECALQPFDLFVQYSESDRSICMHLSSPVRPAEQRSRLTQLAKSPILKWSNLPAWAA
jgi:hypothetical protein